MKKQRVQIGFTLLLLTWVVVLLVLALDLGRIAAMVPLWVGGFTLAMLIVQLFLTLSSVRAPATRKTRDGGAALPADDGAPPRLATATGADEAPFDTSRTLRVASWFLLMVVAIYLLGILAAVPLYAFAYWKWRAGEGWRTSLAMAGTVMGGLYIFARLLDKTLYKGLLALWAGL